MMRLLVGLALLCAFASVISASASAEARPTHGPDITFAGVLTFPLDHFWCYRTQGTTVDQRVQLQDQFDTALVDTLVGVPQLFCNPTRKNFQGIVTKIQHPNDHLLWYQIGVANPTPSLKVLVVNQFGKARLAVFLPAVALAVPTQKNTLPPPVDTDHFKCYRVSGPSLNLGVTLRDQFQRSPNLVVSRPVFLCNPTVKVHNAKTFPILHPESHLVCYVITRVRFTQNILTFNQFRQEAPIVTNPNLLCVPSKKRILP
jgi:hypothetical protein